MSNIYPSTWLSVVRPFNVWIRYDVEYFILQSIFSSLLCTQGNFFSFLSQASQEGFWSKWWHDSRTSPNREKQFLLFLEIWQRKIAKVQAMYAKRIFRILLFFAFVLNFTHKKRGWDKYFEYTTFTMYH